MCVRACMCANLGGRESAYIEKENATRKMIQLCGAFPPVDIPAAELRNWEKDLRFGRNQFLCDFVLFCVKKDIRCC